MKTGALPPGPRLPALVQTALHMRWPGEFFAWCHRRFGDPFTLRNVIFGTQVIVVRPNLVREVFTGDHDVLRAGEVNLTLRSLVGTQSVLTLDGPEHFRHRRIMLPSFHGDRMQAYAGVMREAVERVFLPLEDGARVRLHPLMQRVTLDVILRAVFGAEEGAEYEALRDAMRDLLDIGDHPLAFVALFEPAQVDLGALTPWREFKRRRARSDSLLYAQIARRRAAPRGGDDVLAMLLDARDDSGRPLGDDELRDELMTLLVAGHEASATALCWIFEEVLRAPHIAERILEELAAVTGGAPLEGEHVGQLLYLDAVVREALRLHPIIPAVTRRLSAPWRLGEWQIPKGTLVVSLACETHMLADVYPEPARFDPDRFLGKKPDPYAWYPFGGGPRRCLGVAFALYEAKVVVATILARHAMRLTTTQPPRTAVRGITFAPHGGTEVVVAKRSASRTGSACGRPADRTSCAPSSAHRA
jgi:cytochrome P450